MKLIEFTGVKGGPVWVNPGQVLYVGLPEAAAASMYGDNNARAATRLHLSHGTTLDLRDPLADVVARLNG
jgi:hypothetical protein